MEDVTSAPVTTRQRYPWKAALRTVIQTAIPLALAAIAAGALITDFIEHAGPGSPVVAWITAGVALLSGLSGLLARLAVLPAVDAALQHLLRLGSAPAGVAVTHLNPLSSRDSAPPLLNLRLRGDGSALARGATRAAEAWFQRVCR